MREPDDVAAPASHTEPDHGLRDDLDETLRRITSALRDALLEADHAGLVIARRGEGTRTRGATDALVVELDGFQRELDEGPGLHAMHVQHPIRVDHAAQDPRWPRFLGEAVRRGVRAQLSVPVRIDEKSGGALSVYSTSHDTWSADSERVVGLVAAPTGLVLAQAHRVENLSTALESRTTIGIALGITMQRFDLDKDLAFAYLTRVAATTETKLRDVAESLISEHVGRADGAARADPG